MKRPLTTGELADLLGEKEVRIQDLIRRGKLRRPEKIAGRRAWTDKDVDAARKAVAANPTP